MPDAIQSRIRRSRLFGLIRETKYRSPLFYMLRNRRLYRDFESWKGQGTVPVPTLRKAEIIDGYRERYSLRTLVETGTYFGDTAEALSDRFENIVSIELSPDLHRWAKSRLKRRRNVSLLCGDSATELKTVLADLRSEALFWLDAHFSGGQTALGDVVSPIMSELSLLLGHPVEGHVILIDDARDFIGSGGYPTLDQVRRLVESSDKNYEFAVEEDIIRVFPASLSG